MTIMIHSVCKYVVGFDDDNDDGNNEVEYFISMKFHQFTCCCEPIKTYIEEIKIHTSIHSLFDSLGRY